MHFYSFVFIQKPLYRTNDNKLYIFWFCDCNRNQEWTPRHKCIAYTRNKNSFDTSLTVDWARTPCKSSYVLRLIRSRLATSQKLCGRWLLSNLCFCNIRHTLAPYPAFEWSFCSFADHPRQIDVSRKKVARQRTACFVEHGSRSHCRWNSDREFPLNP